MFFLFALFLADFERYVKVDGEENLTKGEIYYISPFHFYLNVKEPLRQVFFERGDTLIIYYPLHKRAFRFHLLNPFSLPLLAEVKPVNITLLRLGMRILRKETNGERNRFIWTSSAGEYVEIEEEKGHIVYFKYLHKKTGLKTEINFSKFIKIENSWIPTEITATGSSGGKRVRQKWLFYNVRTEIAIPDSIKNFKIPQGIPVEVGEL